MGRLVLWIRERQTHATITVPPSDEERTIVVGFSGLQNRNGVRIGGVTFEADRDIQIVRSDANFQTQQGANDETE